MLRMLTLVLTFAGFLCGMARGQVSFRQGTDKIDVLIDSKPLAYFYYGKEWPKPFLHDLRASSGTTVTRGFPVVKIVGESNDHGWHRGLWFAHGDVSGVDFWRELGGDHTNVSKFPLPLGMIVAKSVPRTRVVGQRGILTVDLEMITSKEKKPIGSLLQEFTFQRRGGNNIIDVRVTVMADKGLDLKFGDTEEGTLGFRFRDEFRQDRGATLTNSDGLVTTEKIWGKRARWVDYSTKVGGETVGVAIMDHPANPKHPTYWHARGYGLCAANPFGEHDFHNDKNRDGSLTVPKGRRMEFHYRIVIHPGDAASAGIDRLHAAWGSGN